VAMELGTLTLRSLQTRSASVAFIFLDFLFRHRTAGYIWAKPLLIVDSRLACEGDERFWAIRGRIYWRTGGDSESQ
jgi:hypothetical protein